MPDLDKLLERFGARKCFEVAKLFINSKDPKVQPILDKINRDFADDGKPQLKRKDVYDCVRASLHAGYIKLEAPIDDKLSEQIGKKYGIKAENVRVVDVRPEDTESICVEAAKVIFEKILEIHAAKKPKPVGLGIGPGYSALVICRHLGNMLSNSDKCPMLKLFGINSGCPPDRPEHAPISFFNLFPEHVIQDRVAVMTEPLMPVLEFKRRMSEVGLKEAFQARDDIDIVLTSMGDFHDEHDGFRKLLLLKPNDRKINRDAWVGSVQYRPYSEHSPIQETDDDFRVATLFELADLVDMANDKRKNKSVVLIVRTCARCGAAKTAALKPLLERPDLRVFTHVLLNSKVARELVE